jgi:hypothetical protein
MDAFSSSAFMSEPTTIVSAIAAVRHATCDVRHAGHADKQTAESMGEPTATAPAIAAMYTRAS